MAPEGIHLSEGAGSVLPEQVPSQQPWEPAPDHSPWKDWPVTAAPSFQFLRVEVSAKSVSPASKIHPESNAFSVVPTLARPCHCLLGLVQRSPWWSPPPPLLRWRHPCSLYSSQGDTVRTSGKSCPYCAQNLTSSSPLCPYLFPLTHCSLCSRHTSLCHSLKSPAPFLPQGLCTCCSSNLHSFPPGSCLPHHFSLPSLFSNGFKCEFPEPPV